MLEGALLAKFSSGTIFNLCFKYAGLKFLFCKALSTHFIHTHHALFKAGSHSKVLADNVDRASFELTEILPTLCTITPSFFF